jgi:GT2 family glycosyltransferase
VGVDVVIVNRNEGSALMRAIRSAQAFGGTPIVVDDGSGDATIDEVTRLPGVAVLRHDRNRGLATAANTGVAAGMGEFVMLLDSDTEIVTGTAADLAARFAVTGAAILGIDLQRTDGSRIPALRNLPRARDLVADLLRLYPLTGRLRGPDAGLPGTRLRGRGCYVVGSAIAMRRSDWEAYGGLDEGYFLWYEDVDLGARVTRSGDAVASCGTVVIRHTGKNSLAAVPRRRRQRLRISSAFRYARRNMGLAASLAVVVAAPAAMLIGIADDVAHGVVDGRQRDRPGASEDSAG